MFLKRLYGCKFLGIDREVGKNRPATFNPYPATPLGLKKEVLVVQVQRLGVGIGRERLRMFGVAGLRFLETHGKGCDAQFLQSGIALGAEVVEHEQAQVFRRAIERQDKMLRLKQLNSLQQLGIRSGDQDRMIPRFNEGLEERFDVFEVDDHTACIRWPFDDDFHPVRVAVEILASAFMPRQPMCAFPAKYLCDFHGVRFWFLGFWMGLLV